MGISNTSLDLGGECSAREEWLPENHPDRVAWEVRRKQERRAYYTQKAKMFHDIYERLAPNFGYVTRTDTREFNPDSDNGRLMIAVMEEMGL